MTDRREVRKARQQAREQRRRSVREARREDAPLNDAEEEFDEPDAPPEPKSVGEEAIPDFLPWVVLGGLLTISAFFMLRACVVGPTGAAHPAASSAAASSAP